MTRKELKALCEALKFIDDNTGDCGSNPLIRYANRISRQMGFKNWQDARRQL